MIYRTSWCMVLHSGKPLFETNQLEVFKEDGIKRIE